METRRIVVPGANALQPNYSNPFNPIPTIRYAIAGSRETKLVVYDLLGREVAMLVNEKKSPGSYVVEFDARLPGGQGSNLASGVYFYRLQADVFSQTRRLVILK